MNKETEKKLNQLQLYEQNIQSLIAQKQNFQAQLMEIENALKELSETKEETYKLIGNILVKKNKEDLINELDSKKEVINIRVKNINKQEEQIKEKAEKLQSEVVKEIKQ